MTSANTDLGDDPLLALVGSGKHLWGDDDPDEYVRKLREGWETDPADTQLRPVL